MELLLNLSPPEDVKSDILPMLYKTLELDSKPVQEMCLSAIPSLAAIVDGPSMKNALLPRIKRLCLSTSDLSVCQINITIAFVCYHFCCIKSVGIL